MTIKKTLTGAAIAVGLLVGSAGTASAGNGPNPKACDGLTNAHNTMIAAQGLERHLGLNVHQVFSTKLLPNACS